MLTHVFPNKDAWLDFRAGMFTSSNIHKLMADGKRAMTDEEIAAAKKENPRSKATTIYDENVLSEGAITYIEDVVSAQFAKREPDFYSKSMACGCNLPHPAVDSIGCFLLLFSIDSFSRL